MKFLKLALLAAVVVSPLGLEAGRQAATTETAEASVRAFESKGEYVAPGISEKKIPKNFVAVTNLVSNKTIHVPSGKRYLRGRIGLPKYRAITDKTFDAKGAELYLKTPLNMLKASGFAKIEIEKQLGKALVAAASLWYLLKTKNFFAGTEQVTIDLCTVLKTASVRLKSSMLTGAVNKAVNDAKAKATKTLNTKLSTLKTELQKATGIRKVLKRRSLKKQISSTETAIQSFQTILN
ncbi:hypothetical protein KAT92_03055 [Candidatus Babeliales bacterium]|nr:hypothetical protein [Candidatus Babeliales bacterium]